MPTVGPFIGDYYVNVTSYKAIEDAARVLASEEGRRKAFVYISESTPNGPSEEMMAALRRAQTNG
jgi:translation initiation factor 2B subunit (eIF-2B alpha/beta/delta family)